MRLSMRTFRAALLGCGVLQLAACNQGGPAAKSKPTEPVALIVDASPGVAALPDGAEPGADPVIDLTPPALPTGPKAETPPGVSFDPFGKRDPGKSKAVFEGPAPPKTTAPNEAAEQAVPPLPVPKAGEEAPALKPQLVTLTWAGGVGNQWIQDVGFTADGRIYATSGGGAFTVYYSGDGAKLLKVEGDRAKASTGPRGPNVSTRGVGAFRTTEPTTKIQLEIGMESFGPTRTQPYLRSSADWKWWGWSAADMGKGLEANARGIRVHWLHDDRFLAKVFVDGGKTTVAKEPTDLKQNSSALAAAALRDPAGPGTLYMIGRLKNGSSEHATFVKGKALAEALDPWERLYVSQLWEGKTAQDGLKIGGNAGFCVLNSSLTNPLYTASIGADHVYCMALKDNILVIGGSIGAVFEPDPKVKPKNLVPQRLPVRNPAQDAPGEDEDGFLAIIRLW